jgi:hypothetical protein
MRERHRCRPARPAVGGAGEQRIVGAWLVRRLHVDLQRLQCEAAGIG